MKTNQELKNAALAALKGNWGTAVLCSLVIFAVFFGLSLSIPSEEPVVLLVCMAISLASAVFLRFPLQVGFYNTFRVFVSEGDCNMISNTFKIAFANYWHNVNGMLLMNIRIILWTMLFIIPGIIKSFSYAMTPYILAERPELSVSEAIDLSCEMMDGHKERLFGLCMGFIGWGFLAILTLGIGFFWLVPYMNTTIACFYEELKAESRA